MEEETSPESTSNRLRARASKNQAFFSSGVDAPVYDLSGKDNKHTVNNLLIGGATTAWITDDKVPDASH